MPTTAPTFQVTVAQTAAVIGFLSVVVVFLASLGGWSFARGIAAVIPLPNRLFGIRASFDAFSSVVVQNVGAFATAVGFGVAIGVLVPVPRWLLWRLFYMTAASVQFTLALAGISDVDKHASRSALLTVISEIAPSIVAFMLAAADVESFRLMVAMLFCPALPLLYALRLYNRGKRAAADIIKRVDLAPRDHERALSSVKIQDYPLLTLCASQELALPIQGISRQSQFIYQSRSNAFMKLLATDDTYIYVVANVSGKVHSAAIAKAVVSQMVFARGLAHTPKTA